MNSHFSWQPPFEWTAVLAGLVALFVAWLVLRVVSGAPAGLARRASLFVLRGALLLTLIALFAGPVRVDESPGTIRRPDVFVLLDGSQSMAIGKSSTRWDDALGAFSAAAATTDDESVRDSLHLFRFGHRLSAVERGNGRFAELDFKGPTDTDTRLAEALRQMSGRFGERPPGAVVLFSDGRVRDAAAVEQMAEHFGQRNIPLHVYPVGDTARGGDVAVISVVAPARVRKYSDVDVQVFLRSFGYGGKRTEVQLVALDDAGQPEEALAVLPITLRGGAQSVTLSYRSDTRSRRIAVQVPEQEDELTAKNNRLTAEVAIDRTKIRVLYIEGNEGPLRVVSRADRMELAGAFTTLQEVLTEDEDIECVTLVELLGNEQLYRVQAYGQSGARQSFPETLAELSAFDCVIISDAAAASFTEEQLGWLEHWVANRGGGLLMAGGPSSFAAGGWRETPLAEMLPVIFTDSQWSPVGESVLKPTPEATSHAVWQIVADRQLNAQILASVPPVEGLNQGLVPKPLTDVLAVTNGDATQPALVAGRYGRGRTMALAVPVTAPAAERFLHEWGASGNRYSGKFWRNAVYWLTEGSSIGRRRLMALADKRFYRPGETITLSAVAYDETARRTTGYSVWAMIEPQSLDFDAESFYAPIRWPNGLARESGEESPFVAWGEEFELPKTAENQYRLPLELTDRLLSGASDEGLRVELTAYEGQGGDLAFSRGTQVDSTSLDIQVLDDPFEQQNPFPNHDLLRRVARLSGGRVLESPMQLAAVVTELPVETGPPIISTVPIWDRWWLWAALVGLLTLEWGWRRTLGLA